VQAPIVISVHDARRIVAARRERVDQELHLVGPKDPRRLVVPDRARRFRVCSVTEAPARGSGFPRCARRGGR